MKKVHSGRCQLRDSSNLLPAQYSHYSQYMSRNLHGIIITYYKRVQTPDVTVDITSTLTNLLSCKSVARRSIFFIKIHIIHSTSVIYNIFTFQNSINQSIK